MDLPYGEERTKQFVTNVGLITSNGPYGHNIMGCEWTHQVSYSPGMIAVHIGKHVTKDNIQKTKEFGVNLAAADQNALTSIAGGSSRKDVDKISALKELGYKFFKAKKIDVMMVERAAMQAECKLVKTIELGDHTMFVGEVVELYPAEKEPIVYHAGKYWNLNTQVTKPSQEELDKIKEVVEKYKKS
tara:strand:- start:3771 stop:4331 length:561 start_codon:yes stop_codon:yes gene_type:complete